MNRRFSVFVIPLLVICSVILLPIQPQVVTPEELKMIEKAVPENGSVVPDQPRRLLVFTLHEGFVHSSIPYATAALKTMGRKTGAFEVVQSQDMSVFQPESLGQFDAVCFNNSTKLTFEDPILRQSLIDFVKGGKGLIGIHAATDNFYNWPEAAEMMGGLFDGHPWRSDGTWAVRINDPDHPLTAAFDGQGFQISDEIYRIKAPYSPEKVRVLLSLDMTDETNLAAKGVRPTDRDIPISWVRSYGEGRVFYCSFGHNHPVFWNPAILQHYLDGIQFALGDLTADTSPSIDVMLQAISSYEYGQSRELLTDFSGFLRTIFDSPESLNRIEGRLLGILKSDATLAGKQFVSRKLSLLGTESSVPTLAEMLTDSATSDMARYALERIPGDGVNEVLRTALPNTSGHVKVGIINSLGQRGDGNAVAGLSALIRDPDRVVAVAAVAALGKIAGPDATAVLGDARAQTSGKLRLAVLDAYLKCADDLAAKGENSSATEIYRELFTDQEPTPIRSGALSGMVRAAGEAAGSVILEVLRQRDTPMQSVAIGLISEVPVHSELEEIAAELSNLTVVGQVQLLTALADRGDTSVRDVVVSATESDPAEVRIAAIEALGVLGDESALDVLINIAAADKGDESQAARESIYRLRGAGVDEMIVARIPQADPNVKVELIRSVDRRTIYPAVTHLLETAKDPESDVRTESAKALKVVADQTHLPDLVRLLIGAQDERERNELERTVVAVAKKIPDENRRAESVLTVLPGVKEIGVRGSLFQVLGRIGDGTAMPVLQKGLEEKNHEIQVAAIRALSDWPTSEPAHNLLKVVQDSDNKFQQFLDRLRGAKASDVKIRRALALRGYVHLIGLESDGLPEETIGIYRTAMELTSDVSEKKMVLAGLANLESLAALEMAAGYLEDENLQQEASAAALRIARSIYGDYPQETKNVLQRVLQISTDDDQRNRIQRLIDRIE